MKQEQGEIMLTKDDVMKMLNVSLSTVNRLMTGKDIPFHKMKGNVRFKHSDVEKYIEDTRHE